MEYLVQISFVLVHRNPDRPIENVRFRLSSRRAGSVKGRYRGCLSKRNLVFGATSRGDTQRVSLFERTFCARLGANKHVFGTQLVDAHVAMVDEHPPDRANTFCTDCALMAVELSSLREKMKILHDILVEGLQFSAANDDAFFD